MEISLGSCRGYLELPGLNSIQILIDIPFIFKGNQSRQLYRRSGSAWDQFQSNSYQNSIDFERESVSAVVEDIWECLNSVPIKILLKSRSFLKEICLGNCREGLECLGSVPIKFLFKFNWFLKGISLGSCIGYLGVPELSSIQILIEIQLISKGHQSRQA